jgi:hypothetical protein
MWLQSRDVTKMTVYRAKQLRLGHLNIYRESLILDRTLSNITMCSIIYIFWHNHAYFRTSIVVFRFYNSLTKSKTSIFAIEIVIVIDFEEWRH